MIPAFITQHLLYATVLASIAGALLHWYQQVRRGQASPDFFDHWFGQTKGFTAGVASALAGQWMIWYQTGTVSSMDPLAAIGFGYAFGFTTDSMIAPGAVKAVEDAASKVAGFVRLHMLPLLIVCALVAGCLSGCATVAGSSPAQGAAEDQLEKVTKADLDSAIAEASAAGDDQAVKCFTLVQDFVGKGAPAADIKGVFSAFEATRLLRRRVDTGVPEELHIACAPLILDARITLVKLGLIAAGAGL